jgi:8-oxo-dGTP pyrophosphatase MutT (NUDIX family)
LVTGDSRHEAGSGGRPAGQWLDRGDTVIYDSAWVRLVTTDVVMPDGTRIDHHVVRLPHPAAGTIMIERGQVLLLWRHRFITDSWGWEIPAGAVDAGESLVTAAQREAVEESGWRPRTLEHLCAFHPANGVLDQMFHIFVSHDAEHLGEPTDVNEAARVEWRPIEAVRTSLLGGEITDGLSFGGLSYAFAAGAL